MACRIDAILHVRIGSAYASINLEDFQTSWIRHSLIPRFRDWFASERRMNHVDVSKFVDVSLGIARGRFKVRPVDGFRNLRVAYALLAPSALFPRIWKCVEAGVWHSSVETVGHPAIVPISGVPPRRWLGALARSMA